MQFDAGKSKTPARSGFTDMTGVDSLPALSGASQHARPQSN
jgi:hypothetical protein